MRVHFKYANGYVNADDESICLTTSGNWAETKKLKEKSRKTEKENRRRINRISFFVYVVAAAIVLILLFALTNDNVNKIIFVALPVIGLKIFGYFKPDLGKRYRIPVSKIQSLEPVSDGYEIHFINLDGEFDSETITGIQGNGAQMLSEIRLAIFPLNEYLNPSETGIR